MILRILVAAVTLIGSAVVVKAFTIPYTEICEAAQSCPFDNHLPSLMSDASYQVNPLVAVPALAVAVAIVAAGGLIVFRGPVGSRIATVVLGIASLVTLGFFAWLENSYYLYRWGSVVGSLGSAVMVLAAVIAAVTVFRTKARTAGR